MEPISIEFYGFFTYYVVFIVESIILFTRFSPDPKGAVALMKLESKTQLYPSPLYPRIHSQFYPLKEAN
jgi:hypothetical protein